MQSRSIRPAGQPTCAKAFLNARCWSGPDPRRALWPAVMGTASKGRTHGCTDQCCKTVKKALAKPGPSTHGTFRTRLRLETVMRCKADIGGDEHRGLFKQVTLNRGRPMAPARQGT